MSLKSSPKILQNFIHDTELLWRSRGRQVEDTVLRNQRLEQELWITLEDRNSALMREQVGMRRKVEEARQVLLTGLSKVKELEVKAAHVPALQRQIVQLESELLYYRYTHH